MTSLFVAGVGIAVGAFAGRAIWSAFREASKRATVAGPSFFNVSPYYKGGFEPKMTKREAGLILGLSPSSPMNKVRDYHKKTMLLNHPDRGGSPYVAAKINQAKDLFESGKESS